MVQTNKQQNGRRNMSSNGNTEKLAGALGWFSVGLGLAEVIMPGGLASLIGVNNTPKNRAVLRTFGVREMAAGIGILTQSQPAGWVWGRVAGDVLDLATLGSALSSSNSNRGKLITATAAVAGVTALDVFCGKQLSDGAKVWKNGPVRVFRSINIGRSPEEVYGFWRDFGNMPNFMSRVQSVQILGDRRSHWKARAAGVTLEWDAEITLDEPNHVIAWRSIEGAPVGVSGRVEFEPAPGERGTLVKAEIRYSPPGGSIAASVAKLFGLEPGQVLQTDLRALKELMETGEILVSDASIHKGMHPARAPESPDAIERQGAVTLSPSLV